MFLKFLRKMNRYRHSFIFLMILLFSFQLFADWKQAGLAGKEVTALVADTLPGGEALLIAGTKSDGVWCRRGSSGQFQLLDDLGAVTPSPFLKGIKHFSIHKQSHRLFAGSDSGLSWYPLVSLIEPRWSRVTGVSFVAVTDVMGLRDTLFCCTPADVYRSFNGSTTWTACSTRKALPPPGNITCFTSLAYFCGINAGSRFLGALNSWLGVLNSGDLGGTWKDVSILPPSQHVGQVYDLVQYRQSFDGQNRLLVAVDNGLKYIETDLDTAVWHPLDPQLKEVALPKSLYVTYYSNSALAEIFVSSDSGVHVLSKRFSTSGWVRIFDKKTDCVASFVSEDPIEWVAGTADGVWIYSSALGIVAKSVKPVTRSTNRLPIFSIRLDGKKLAEREMNASSGIIIKSNGERIVRFKSK